MQKYFQKGWTGEDPIQYPLFQVPYRSSDLVSPRVGNHHGTTPPLFPGDEGFEECLHEVIAVREKIVNQEWPEFYLKIHHPRDSYSGKLPEPLKLAGLSESNPKGCAIAVHMDNPVDLHSYILKWLLDKRYVSLQVDSPHNEFLHAIPRTMARISSQVDSNLEMGFEAKYEYGLARPEETSGMGPSITAYPEGCPNHPSAPAGHACAAAAASVFFNDFELNEFEQDEVFDSAYCWAMFRTFAGVHYTQDNIMGLKLGGLWGMYVEILNNRYSA